MGITRISLHLGRHNECFHKDHTLDIRFRVDTVDRGYHYLLPYDLIDSGDSDGTNTVEFNEPIVDEHMEGLLTGHEEFDVSDQPSKDGLPSELDFADDLHHMTHQNVTAVEKWGHLEITGDRLNDMYGTVGKATGMMTETEEAEHIDEHFE